MNKQIVFYIMSGMFFWGIDSFSSDDKIPSRSAFKPVAVNTSACTKNDGITRTELKVIPASDNIAKEIDINDVTSLVELYSRARELEVALGTLQRECQRSAVEKEHYLREQEKKLRRQERQLRLRKKELSDEEKKLRVLSKDLSPKVAATVIPKIEANHAEQVYLAKSTAINLTSRIRANYDEQKSVREQYNFVSEDNSPTVEQHHQIKAREFEKTQNQIQAINKKYAELLPALYRKCSEYCSERAQATEKQAAKTFLTSSSGQVRKLSSSERGWLLYEAERIKDHADFFAHIDV